MVCTPLEAVVPGNSTVHFHCSAFQGMPADTHSQQWVAWQSRPLARTTNGFLSGSVSITTGESVFPQLCETHSILANGRFERWLMLFPPIWVVNSVPIWCFMISQKYWASTAAFILSEVASSTHLFSWGMVGICYLWGHSHFGRNVNIVDLGRVIWNFDSTDIHGDIHSLDHISLV